MALHQNCMIYFVVLVIYQLALLYIQIQTPSSYYVNKYVLQQGPHSFEPDNMDMKNTAKISARMTIVQYEAYNNRSLTQETTYTKPALKKLLGLHEFPNLPSLFNVPRLDCARMPRVVTKDTYDALMRLVNLSMNVLDAHNVSYTLAYGSLLGSYVMHDLLPWDDDVDIFIHNDSKAKVMDLFKDDRHFGIQGFHEHWHRGYLYKLYFNSSKPAGEYPWKWPFIDIVTYVDDGEWLQAVDRKTALKWPKSSFYPRHLRPFGPLWIPAPREPAVFLKAKYRRFRCKTSPWNHEKEIAQKVLRRNCSELAASFPFVKRSELANNTMETLVLDGKELYTIYVDEPFTKQESIYGW